MLNGNTSFFALALVLCVALCTAATSTNEFGASYSFEELDAGFPSGRFGGILVESAPDTLMLLGGVDYINAPLRYDNVWVNKKGMYRSIPSSGWDLEVLLF